MTLIIGMYYDNKKGALIASDSRITYGGECGLSKKIYYVEKGKKVIFACCGTDYTNQEIGEICEGVLSGKKDSLEIRRLIRGTQKEILSHHNLEVPQGERKNTSSIIFGFNFGFPEIYSSDNGHLEIVEGATTMGSLVEYTNRILKEAYNEKISQKEAIDLAIYCITKTAQGNIYIDDNPQIALIDEKGSRILNYDKGRNFDFYKFSNATKYFKDIDRKQKRALEILLRGNKKTKKSLAKILGRT